MALNLSRFIHILMSASPPSKTDDPLVISCDCFANHLSTGKSGYIHSYLNIATHVLLGSPKLLFTLFKLGNFFMEYLQDVCRVFGNVLLLFYSYSF